jgi:hypothetical protein
VAPNISSRRDGRAPIVAHGRRLEISYAALAARAGERLRAALSHRHRVSSDNPRLNAFWRVAPSVRFSCRPMRAAGVFSCASLFKVRISSDDHARSFIFFAMAFKPLTCVTLQRLLRKGAAKGGCQVTNPSGCPYNNPLEATCYLRTKTCRQ